MAVDETGGVIDRNALLKRLGGDENLMGEVFELFLEDGPRMLRVLRDAFDRQDAPGVERAAHSLKGALLNLSADPAADLARSLEERGRAASFEGAEEGLSKLEDEFRRLEAVLRDKPAS